MVITVISSYPAPILYNKYKAEKKQKVWQYRKSPYSPINIDQRSTPENYIQHSDQFIVQKERSAFTACQGMERESIFTSNAKSQEEVTG